METANGSKNGASANGKRYAFDNFEIEAANRILLRDGVEVPLTGKAFDILQVFVENPGRLLEKNELLEKVWPGDFVEEGNLARNVSTLRKALGDHGKEYKYIATVQGHGYRFVADVFSPNHSVSHTLAELDPKPLPPTANNGNNSFQFDDSRPTDYEIDPVEPIRTQLYRRPLLLSITGFLLIAAIVFAFRMGGSKIRQVETLSIERFRQSKLTQEGDVYGGVISPDGKYLAYTKINGADRGLSVRQIATESVLDLQPPQKDVSYWAKAFAPDNTFLYYILREQGSEFGNIYRISLLGGQRRKLISFAAGGLTVSADGRKLAFTRIDKQNGTASIVVADTDGANEKTISSSNLDSMYYSLDWSPDGNFLLYSFKRNEGNQKYWYLAEIPADGGEERRIGEISDLAILTAKWLPDKSGFVVCAVDGVTRKLQIFSVSYPDGTRRPITNDSNEYVGFSMTSDARSIVLAQNHAHRQIWELADGKTTNAVQISNGTEKHFDSVSWAGDQYLVFDQDETEGFNHFNIYRCRTDGTDLQQLTFGSGNNQHPAVSPDGKTIVYVSGRSGTRQLWRMNIEGGDDLLLTDVPQDRVIQPAFSPDGQTIFFSVSVGGRCNIWKISVNGGETSTVIDGDVYQWAVSPDGLNLAYSTFIGDAKKVQTRIHSLQQDKPDIVVDISPEEWMEFSKDGKALYFNTVLDGIQNIWRQPLDGGGSHPVTAFNTEQTFRFSWSPDGKNLTVIRHNTTYDAVILNLD